MGGETYSKYYDFYADLKRGQVGEELAEVFLIGDAFHVEVKTDFRAKETGNLYIEMECDYGATGNYVPSGFATTKAEVAAFVFGQSVYFVKMDCVNRVVKLYGREIECRDSQNPSKGYLITPMQLIEMEWRRSK